MVTVLSTTRVELPVHELMTTGESNIQAFPHSTVLSVGQETSNGLPTVVIWVTGLLAGMASGLALDKVAVFVSEPVLMGVTTIVSAAAELLAIAPKLHTTAPALNVQPGEAETKVTPVGSVSVTVTLAATVGPELEIERE